MTYILLYLIYDHDPQYIDPFKDPHNNLLPVPPSQSNNYRLPPFLSD